MALGALKLSDKSDHTRLSYKERAVGTPCPHLTERENFSPGATLLEEAPENLKNHLKSPAGRKGGYSAGLSTVPPA